MPLDRCIIQAETETHEAAVDATTTSFFEYLQGIARNHSHLAGPMGEVLVQISKHGAKQIIPIAGFSASIRPVVDNNRNLVFGFNVHDVQGNVGADERHRTAIRAGIADWMLSDRRL